MRKIKGMSVLLLIAVVGLICGCGSEKEQDPTKSGVVKISITPQPSPTPAPSELAPEAVVTEGNLTMVNEYLANGK